MRRNGPALRADLLVILLVAGFAIVSADSARAVIVPLASPASFTSVTVEQFLGTQTATPGYSFGNGMTYVNLNGANDLINLGGTYGLGQSGNLAGGRGGTTDRYFGAGSAPTTFRLTFSADDVTGFGFYGAEAFDSGSVLNNASLTLEFYDAADGLLGTTTVATPGPASSAWVPFFGFASDGAPIGSVVFRDAGFMAMDDVHFGAAAVPEPATATTSAVAATVLTVAARRPRRRRA